MGVSHHICGASMIFQATNLPIPIKFVGSNVLRTATLTSGRLVDSTNYLWPSMPSTTSLWPYLPGSFINSFATSLGTVVRSSCTAEKTLSYSLRAVLIAKRLEYKILHKANFGRHSVRHPMHDLGMWKSEALVARYTSKALRVS